MKKSFIAILFCALACFAAQAQDIDTLAVYQDREDELDASLLQARQKTNTLSKYGQNRVETITAAGLCTMACCNLAESFENSASVTVGYSDAVTGARQIKLLGLSGIYTQMLDENRPVMRGLAAPFGLTYVPGQWLESIQIAKGTTSVINGVESLTGQINMEHRKPTDEKPLFINASIMSDTKADLNIASSLQLNEAWSTAILGHVSGNFLEMDHNHDGFMDDPKTLQLNLANRWLYYSPNGTQVRFGFRLLRDAREGGEMSNVRDGLTGHAAMQEPWKSNILNQSANGYLKVGVPLNEDNSQNIAAVLDYNYYDMASNFGTTIYNAGQHSGFLNLLYQNEMNENHKFTVGAGSTIDSYLENIHRIVPMAMVNYKMDNLRTLMANVGVFGEYTYHFEDKFSAIAGLRGEWYYGHGFRVSPRLTLKYNPIEDIVIRANAGRGLRYSNPLVDNIGVFSTSKDFITPVGGNGGLWEYSHTLEDAWTFGGNITYYFPLVPDGEKAYISFDYFRSQFVEQSIVDYEFNPGSIAFYNLSQVPGRPQSYTNTYQLDFSCEPVERFTITLTGRYTDARYSTIGGFVERPMNSRYKAVLNLQYSTNLSKWIFDFTASLNGPCRVYNFMEDLKDANGNLLYKNGKTPIYPLLYAQVTRRFKGVDVYIGGENLTNFRQKHVILGERLKDAQGNVTHRVNTLAPAVGAVKPEVFDASCVWGPLMGIKIYAGVRFTLWKTEK